MYRVLGLFTENGQPDLEVVLLQEGGRACGTSEEGTYRYVDVLGSRELWEKCVIEMLCTPK